ncbi:hypothetical protein MIND_00297900 [Mycena indigotica]|uniref:F-box domain-containing protein n=1 Tax=Mycena indigotica TaxID=2126181 RepID=A0A8H6T1E8_9AGAR|nr:uncharacterized protein MIND_00297900 [Mycena indigotica]KAF7309276.1 hypothetical protein MIND_00297900 [Mycena indigotica]
MSFAKLPAELLSEIAAYCPSEHTTALRGVNKMMSEVMARAFFGCLPLMLSPEGLREGTRAMLTAVASGKTGWGRWARHIRVVLRGADAPVVNYYALINLRDPAALAAQDERDAFFQRQWDLEQEDVPLLERAFNVMPKASSASFEWGTLDLPHGVNYAILQHLGAAGADFHELSIHITATQGWLDKRPDPSWPTFDNMRSLTLETLAPHALSTLAYYLWDAGSTRALSCLKINGDALTSHRVWNQLNNWNPSSIREFCVNETSLFAFGSVALEGMHTLESLHILPRPRRPWAERRRWAAQLTDNENAARGVKLWTALAAAADTDLPAKRIRLKELRVPKLYEGLAQYLLSYAGLEVLMITSASRADLPITIAESDTGADDEDTAGIVTLSASTSAAESQTAEAENFFHRVLAKHAGTLRVLRVTAPHPGQWSFGRHNADAIRQLTNVQTLIMSVDVDRVGNTLKAALDSEDNVNAVDRFLATITDLPDLRRAALLGTVPWRRRREDWENVVSAGCTNRTLRAIEAAVEQAAPGQLRDGVALFAGRNVYCQKQDGTYGVLETLSTANVGSSEAEMPLWGGISLEL